ncbi:hypothetical protein [Pseudoxanthomonas sacheonensis]|uniref:Energy transducer TonB n=1 Tax=Pseudoxanthomonas sacheonensis TaxID=443615 RepID=A0ABU1RVA5_9GAMM|nr:hypothetical protein [Pseudoxanthomonas sacheonensis]MDR6842706.1 hypothetical protein [Pseudoxanthomonas sacheonensis]
MGSEGKQGYAAQIAAWLGVMAVHVGLFWVLTYQDRESRPLENSARLRLLFIDPVPRPTPPSPPTPSAVPQAQIRQSASMANRPAVVLSPPPTIANPTSDLPITAAELLEQGREQAREQAPPSFAADPLRSRRPQLPGGERRGSFRMREPLSAAKVVGFIGKAFGDPGPPCPRIQARISGLLTATSDRERELLDEELRRDREYCRP